MYFLWFLFDKSRFSMLYPSWLISHVVGFHCFHCLQGAVYDLAISPDGQYLASAGEDRRILLWDLSAGNMVKEFRGHTDTVYSLAFSTDGTLLASGGLDNSVKIWDFGQAVKTSHSSSATVNSSPELMASFSTKNNTVHCVQFSSCNLVFAAGSQTTWGKRYMKEL